MEQPHPPADTPVDTPQLTDLAREILFRVSHLDPPELIAPVTPYGCLLVLGGETMTGGPVLQATWRVAVDELLEKGMIVKLGGCRYRMTEKGM